MNNDAIAYKNLDPREVESKKWSRQQGSREKEKRMRMSNQSEDTSSRGMNEHTYALPCMGSNSMLILN